MLLFRVFAAGGFLFRSGGALGFHYFHFRPFGQAINAVCHYAVARRNTCADHHFLTVLNARRHQMFADLVFAIQHPDKMAFIAHLQGGGGDHHGVLFGVD